MLKVSEIGSAPERTRVRKDAGAGPMPEQGKMHGGIWAGREKERKEAIEQTRRFNELNGEANYVPTARSIPYDPSED